VFILYCITEQQRIEANILNVPWFGRSWVFKWASRVRVTVFNATFNNISAISLRSVLLMEETGLPGKIRPAASKTTFLS
jgi:hypothetical protein